MGVTFGWRTGKTDIIAQTVESLTLFTFAIRLLLISWKRRGEEGEGWCDVVWCGGVMGEALLCLAFQVYRLAQGEIEGRIAWLSLEGLMMSRVIQLYYFSPCLSPFSTVFNSLPRTSKCKIR